MRHLYPGPLLQDKLPMNLDPAGHQDPTHDSDCASGPPEGVHAPDSDDMDASRQFRTRIGKKHILPVLLGAHFQHGHWPPSRPLPPGVRLEVDKMSQDHC